MGSTGCKSSIVCTGILFLLLGSHNCLVDNHFEVSMPEEDVITNYTESCLGHPNGVYTRLLDNCKSYYRCYNESKFEYKCDDDFAFDVVTGECIISEKVECNNEDFGQLVLDCVGKPDGVYVDFYSHCHNYYWCENGQKMDFTCGQHMAFDLRTSSCMDSSLSKCQVPNCTSRDNGYYPLPETDSKLYFSCQEGSPTAVFTCPTGRSLDPQVGSCRIFPFINPGFLDCSAKADGYYPDFANNCHSFYYCNDSELKLVLACPPGKAFNILTNQCEEAGLVTCSMTHWSRSFFSGCEDKTNGLHPDFTTECKSFYECKNDERVRNFTCQDGQRFNRVIKKCDEELNVVCSTAIVHHFQNFCIGKLNGFYPNLVTGCRSFLYCQEGRIASEITCPKGNVYDASKKYCVEESEATSCVSDLTQWECVGNKDGYYADLESDCKRYFYCVGGSKLLELVCPLGKLFDPNKKLCVAEDQVVCQASSDDPECAGRSDGYYPNLSSGCRKFFYCRGREKMSEMSCPPEQIFDQEAQACAAAHSTTCHGTMNEECLTDGFHGDAASNCATYSFCLRGRKMQSFQCPLGTIFDSSFDMCVDEKTAQCRSKILMENCMGKTNGFHPLSLTLISARFYLCQDNRLAATLDCPPGGIFNPNSSRCEPRKTSNQCNRTTDNCCAGLPDGYYLMNSSNFYSCFKSHLTRHKCPNSLKLDWETISCKNQGSINNGDEGNECKSRENRFITNLQMGCRQFNLCVSGHSKLRGVCPWGSVFDEGKGYCRSPQQFKCPNMKQNKPGFNCSGKANAYYADVNANCTQFVLCIEERHVATNSCSEGNVFVEKEQHCMPVKVDKYCNLIDIISTTIATMSSTVSNEENNFSSSITLPVAANQHEAFVSNFRKSFEMPEAQPTFPSHPYLLEDLTCKDKTNGVYPDYTSGCRMFYICFRQVKMEFSCSGSLLFNPKTNVCDDPATVVCQQTADVSDETSNDVKSRLLTYGDKLKPEGFTCSSMETGFFPDYLTGCRDFYVCFRGIQKTYSCPAELLFNPLTKNCDAAHNVACDPLATFPPTPSSMSTTTEMFVAKMSKEKGKIDNSFFECPKKSRDVHPDAASGCRNYYICMDGAMHKASCPPGTKYNVKIKHCDLESKVICPDLVTTVKHTAASIATEKITKVITTTTPRPSTANVLPPFDCTGRKDGFYADYNRNCHVFYRCLRGNKLSYYCKLGQLFNPALQICDFEENVRCIKNVS